MTLPDEIYQIYVFVYVLAYAYFCFQTCVCVWVCVREDAMPSEIDLGHLLKST